MIKSIEELKSFILWAKSQKIQKIKIADIEIELSQYAAIESLINPEAEIIKKVQENVESQDDESLLFASSDP